MWILWLPLTSELLVVGRDHHRQLPGVGVVQAGKQLLLSWGGEEVFLLLVACQVHHPRSDVCYNKHLKRTQWGCSYTCLQVLVEILHTGEENISE